MIPQTDPDLRYYAVLQGGYLDLPPLCVLFSRKPLFVFLLDVMPAVTVAKKKGSVKVIGTS